MTLSEEGDLRPGEGIWCDRSSVSVALYSYVWVYVSLCVCWGVTPVCPAAL